MQPAKNKLLIVDDEPVWVSQIKTMAERLSYEVKLLDDSTRFEQEIAGWTPTVVLLDIVMPKRDGVELIQALSEIGYRGRLILMSRSEQRFMQMSEKIAAALGLDVAAVLQKPFTHESILPILTRCAQA